MTGRAVLAARAPGPRLDDEPTYRALFADRDTWAPYVRAVCRHHGLAPAEPVSATLPGTFPTFAAGGRWVVKFFGELFDGRRCHAVEREAHRLAEAVPGLPVPALLAEGALLPDGRWPYLVFAFAPGESLGATFERVPAGRRRALARRLGAWLRRFHAAPLNGLRALRPGWAAWDVFVARQRAGAHERLARSSVLPAHLLAQVEAFLPAAAIPLDRRGAPCLLHGDLTGDHLLGVGVGDGWDATALIDFGDARVGDMAYDLISLQLDLFRLERALWYAFLEGYGADASTWGDLGRRVLALAQAHPFDVLGPAIARDPAARQQPSLDRLAARWWPAS